MGAGNGDCITFLTYPPFWCENNNFWLCTLSTGRAMMGVIRAQYGPQLNNLSWAKRKKIFRKTNTFTAVIRSERSMGRSAILSKCLIIQDDWEASAHTHPEENKNTVVIDSPENFILDPDYLPIWFDVHVFWNPAYFPWSLSNLEYFAVS